MDRFVGDKIPHPLLGKNICNCGEIILAKNKSKRAIEDHFDKNVELELELEKKANEELLKVVRDITDLVDIHYIRQKEAKGLGHAIYCARTFVGNEPFAVMLGDDVVYNEGTPCLKQMIECYDEYKTSVLGVQTVKDEDVCKYGIVDGERVSDRVYTVKGLVEKPAVDEAPSNVAILGRYIINPGIFDILAETKPGKGGEIQLTDALKELALKEDMYAYDFIGKRYDVGNKQGFLEATVETALRRSDLRDGFLQYLVKVVEKEVGSLAEVAAGRED